MPYKVISEDSKFAVYKTDEAGKPMGKALGTHADKPAAQKQMKALYANEEKEAAADTKELPDLQKCGDMVSYGGPVSFAELDAIEEAQEFAHSIERLSYNFPQMAMAIMQRDDIEDKVKALSSLASEFANRVQTVQTKEVDETRWIDKAVEKVRNLIGLDKKEEPVEASFFVWKESDGQYHWLARYSNNIRDNDNPPEIIAAKSHQRFVEMVDKGVYPLPELWLWHRPEWKWGEATAVAYDDSGFAIATGTVDKGCEPVAEWAMKQNLAVSHGMPKSQVTRDKADPTIIIEHQTREISPLFDFAAANKRTGFEIFQKEAEMPIPAEKKEQLKAAGLSDEVLTMLEGKNAADQKEATELGLETKEETPEEEPTPEPEPANTKEEAGLTLELVAKAIGLAVNPIAEQLAVLTKEVEGLKQDDETKFKAIAETTPEDSLKALLGKEMPGLFSEENRVDGRSSLAKSGPKQTPPKQEQEGLFFNGWLSQ